MKQEYINKIREAYLKANSQIARCTDRSCNGMPCRNVEHYRPIQLADVLLAIEFRNGKTRGTKDFNIWVFQKEFTFEDKDGFQYSWNLTKPLEDQEEETLKFIAEII